MPLQRLVAVWQTRAQWHSLLLAAATDIMQACCLACAYLAVCDVLCRLPKRSQRLLGLRTFLWRLFPCAAGWRLSMQSSRSYSCCGQSQGRARQSEAATASHLSCIQPLTHCLDLWQLRHDCSIHGDGATHHSSSTALPPHVPAPQNLSITQALSVMASFTKARRDRRSFARR